MGGTLSPIFKKPHSGYRAILGWHFWGRCANLYPMRTLKLLGRDHTFAVLRGLANPPGDTVTFGALHAAVGCSGRMVMDTVRACVAKGWVTLVAPRAGWRLSIEGEAVLRVAEQLEARDGEPGLPTDPFELLGVPPARVVDTSEFAPNEEPVVW